MRLGVTDRRRRLGLIKRIASFVFLTHSINNEHDNCDSQNQSNDSQADTYYNDTTIIPVTLTSHLLKQHGFRDKVLIYKALYKFICLLDLFY